MRAWELQNAAGFENLKLVTRDVPKAGPGEIIVRLKAASLNYRDLATVAYMGGKVPFVPLSCGAGEVTEVGAGVTRFKSGDRVLIRRKISATKKLQRCHARALRLGAD